MRRLPEGASLCLTLQRPRRRGLPPQRRKWCFLSHFMSGGAWVMAFPSQTDFPSSSIIRRTPAPQGAPARRGWVGGLGGRAFPGGTQRELSRCWNPIRAARPAEAFTFWELKECVQWYRMSLTSASDLPSPIKGAPPLCSSCLRAISGCASAGGPRRSVLYFLQPHCPAKSRLAFPGATRSRESCVRADGRTDHWEV